jgi:CheY-like chemotaxis protein
MNTLKRILLVEDNPADAELAMHGLSDYRLANEVLHVRDGVEALDYLYRRGPFADRPEGLPALVLLDLKMPRIDGTEVLRQLKADPDMQKIPVVVMTSSREDADLLRTYALGANAYVVKPVKFHEFVDAVKQVGSFWGVLNEPPPGTVQSAFKPRG